MNLAKIIKREILITSLTIIGVAITFFGLSYAIYFKVEEKNIGTVSFGQLTLDTCMDESCSPQGTTYGTTITGEVYPMNTTEGTSQTPYLFKVTNNSTSEMNIRVYAAREGLSTDYTNVKLAAKVQGTSTYSYATLTQNVSTLIELSVPAGQSKIIEVYMWLDEQASNSMIGKTISAFINAMSYYKPSDPNSLHTSDTYIANVSNEIVQGQTFNYTGDYREFEVPASGYYFIETWGGQGGGSSSDSKGGYSSGYIYLTKGEKIYIYVGGAGASSSSVNSNPGGWNGGGPGGNNSGGPSYGGGGATDIRYFGSTTPTSAQLEWDSELGLNSRIMVAGGGGGGTHHNTNDALITIGGAGGTLIGKSGTGTYTNSYITADATNKGGSQNAGGTDGSTNANASIREGQFGYASQTTTTAIGGGGGSGYYGGATGYARGGAGGSSFISGYAGVNAITSSSSRTHKNNTKHYSGKYFLDGKMKAGVNSGNGKAIIKYVGLISRIDTKLDNVRYVKDCISRSTANTLNHWVEIQAIQNGANVAKGKTVTATASENSSYPLSRITDGKIATGTYARLETGTQCVTVDLGSAYDLDEIAVWHYYGNPRTYYSNVTSVSSDNSTWTEVINEIMPESVNAKRVSAYSEPLNGYIQDSILALYDGITNNGAEGDLTATTWKNLASTTANGTLVGGATWNTDSLALDGADGGVSLADAFADLFKSSSTVQITVKRNETGVRDILFGSYNTSNSVNFEVTTANKYKVYFDAGTVNTALGTAPANQKYVATFRVNKTSKMIEIYNNYSHNSYLTHTVFNTYNSSFVSAYIGRDSRTGTTCLNGNVYSAKIYSRALTDEEIYHNYLIDKERFGLD